MTRLLRVDGGREGAWLLLDGGNNDDEALFLSDIENTKSIEELSFMAFQTADAVNCHINVIIAILHAKSNASQRDPQLTIVPLNSTRNEITAYHVGLMPQFPRPESGMRAIRAAASVWIVHFFREARTGVGALRTRALAQRSCKDNSMRRHSDSASYVNMSNRLANGWAYRG
ncbi:hypothetical protein SERLADRAFT_441098 [Serpula lacrymans var. lacrymans S7.9]|uniref:Uncharacterized protein n=1 Tax=Serpula lacrymans var. lacrymans (strain S7.9) TaxID=578457 RepID=F8P5I1_SERL9|nr:uncharacterized protein SERLADRAFT_441098 [Serpula lacrymans var. lacrymans S7.9]EGO21868.1 hypothetical protein SERLADRAFT_441098 [Serpula lacrymans var. lacrymans S7.9]